MHAQYSAIRVVALLLGVAVFAASGWAFADPPARVARVGYIAGNVSFSPAGENDWVQARLNRSLTSGDRLWTDRASRVELQVGGAVIRMGENSSLTLLNLDDNIAQVQLDQGTLNVRVRQLGAQQSVEVATPNLAFTTRQAGSYRVEVDPMDDATAIVVRGGRGEVYGESASYAVDSRQAYRFAGSGLRSYEFIATPRPDEFERWASARDRRAESSASAQYVSRDLIGYEDLDANGAWRNEPGYGNVWAPSRVSADWTPYRDGHWTWIDPWGWTWVDDAPWGFAVSHYGRWANFRGSWAWVPGPARSRAVYAPALVAFVGGDNFQLSISGGNVGGVAWFPLGPREVYRPSYPVSRSYFDNVNRSNTTVNNTTITNVYNNINVTNVYVNRQVQGAVVAVPATAFVQSQPVSRAAVRLSREAVVSAPVSAVAAVAPVQQSVRGGATAAASPPDDARTRGEQRVVVRSAPPAARAGFAAQERALAVNPGTPLAPAASAALKPTAPVPAPNVVVAAPPQAAPPQALPPANAPDGKPSARDRRDERNADGERQRDQRARDRGAKGDQGSKGEPPAKPAAAPVAPAPQAAPAPAKPAPSPAQAPPAQIAPVQAAPAGQPQRDEKGATADRQRARERGAKGDQAGTGDQPARPAATPPAPQAAPAQPQAAPAQPAPAAQPKPVPVPPQATPAQAAPAASAPPPRDDKGAKGERQRAREQGGKTDTGTQGDAPAKPVATPVAPPPAAPVQPATPAPVKSQPAPVTPKLEPVPVPVKPAPLPPPVKPLPTPAPAPAPVPAPPPKPEPAPAARQVPIAPPVIAPQPSPPKPRPDADKKDDRKSDRQQKREEAATKKGDEEPGREKGEKK